MKLNKEQVETLLKVATIKLTQLSKQVEVLLKEAKALNRFKEATELVKQMYEKGIITEDKIFTRIEELTKVGDKEFEEIRTKVESATRPLFKGVSSIVGETNDIDRLIADALED
ncbi:MAG: hypothetical protein QXO15_09775 [Nitrososphaerota archaeon]